MKLPDLTNTERMARVGRLAVLKSERRKCAEKLRDALIPVINSTGRIDMDLIVELVGDIKTLDDLLNSECKTTAESA